MVDINGFVCIAVTAKDQGEAPQMVHPRSSWFKKHLDRPGPGMRFPMVFPPKQSDVHVILASGFLEHTGKNRTAVPDTDNCDTYGELRGGGVVFTEGPEEGRFGFEAVFKDLLASSYAMLEPGASHGRH